MVGLALALPCWEPPYYGRLHSSTNVNDNPPCNRPPVYRTWARNALTWQPVREGRYATCGRGWIRVRAIAVSMVRQLEAASVPKVRESPVEVPGSWKFPTVSASPCSPMARVCHVVAESALYSGVFCQDKAFITRLTRRGESITATHLAASAESREFSETIGLGHLVGGSRDGAETNHGLQGAGGPGEKGEPAGAPSGCTGRIEIRNGGLVMNVLALHVLGPSALPRWPLLASLARLVAVPTVRSFRSLPTMSVPLCHSFVRFCSGIPVLPVQDSRFTGRHLVAPLLSFASTPIGGPCLSFLWYYVPLLPRLPLADVCGRRRYVPGFGSNVASSLVPGNFLRSGDPVLSPPNRQSRDPAFKYPTILS
ncbi:hypothetical protein R1flu_006354 [Riccia fluitans]|uniref:Uncharacterized protein n=1 Tax=Riccia fluitans TaxID=41844 RepID=A0ABD1YW44_9MARC